MNSLKERALNLIKEVVFICKIVSGEDNTTNYAEIEKELGVTHKTAWELVKSWEKDKLVQKKKVNISNEYSIIFNPGSAQAYFEGIAPHTLPILELAGFKPKEIQALRKYRDVRRRKTK